MAPLELLILAIAFTAAAWGWSYLARYQQSRLLRKLARTWGMNFVSFDRFRLVERVRELYPMPGAADVRVTDVIYGLGEDHYRYVFTVHYTMGVLRTKHRRERVAGLIEPRSSGSVRPAELRLATESADVDAQYEELGRTMQLGLTAAPQPAPLPR